MDQDVCAERRVFHYSGFVKALATINLEIGATYCWLLMVALVPSNFVMWMVNGSL